MLTALILVCSLATVSNLGDCTRDNALDVIYVPATFASPVTCLMHAQAYVADSSIGRDLPQNEGVKVICVRGPINRVDKAERGPGTRARKSARPTGRTAATGPETWAEEIAVRPGVEDPDDRHRRLLRATLEVVALLCAIGDRAHERLAVKGNRATWASASAPVSISHPKRTLGHRSRLERFAKFCQCVCVPTGARALA